MGSSQETVKSSESRPARRRIRKGAKPTRNAARTERHCMLLPALSSLLLIASWSCPVEGTEPIGSFLYQPAFCMKEVRLCPAEPYLPQPGDIMLRLDHSIFWRVTHYMALACDPNGSGIVFARPDGGLAILEAGPNDTMYCRGMDMLPHLKEYADAGMVWIRKRRIPLTPEQSCRLTEFAMKQNGKRFALLRLGVQLTIFRHRGPLRTWFVGKPCGDRKSYFCSELVTEACCAAGLLDPERTRPSATYPRDLFYGTSFNPFIDRHLDVNLSWYPPARWTDKP
jgi:hypothetical protein